MKKKIILISSIGVALILIVVLLIHSFDSSAKMVGNEQPDKENYGSTLAGSGNGDIVFPVTASIIRKGNLIAWLNTSGYAYAVQDYEIESKISGQVTELNSFDGKVVKKDETLFKLDDKEYQLEVNRYKNDLIKAQIEYDLQKKATPFGGNINVVKYKHELDSLNTKYETAQKLFKEHKINIGDLDRTKRDYESINTIISVKREDVIASMSGLTDAIANYDKAKLNLSYTMFASPINGLIADCKITKGNFVKSNDLCMRVIDISSIKMQCEVTESDIVNIHTGDPVEAEFIALPNKIFSGKVIEINPYIDLDKRTAKVTILLSNPNLLIKPGMFASIKIGSDTYSDVMLIPHSALLVRENKSLVFTVNNGLAQWKYVTLGQSNGQYYIIKDGLHIGDTLIIGGNYNLAHMSKVKITSVEKY